MSSAWAAIVGTVVLLLPGVGFFVGYWAQERYSRELVRSTAIGEVGVALFVAISIHLLLWFFLSRCCNFDPAFYFTPLVEYGTTPNWILLGQFISKLWPTLIYVLASTITGFFIGLLIGWMVMFGWLRVLATHKWAYDLIKEKNRGHVTTYVLTTIVENNKALMYSGHLEDFYLDEYGRFSYVVLKNCSSYFMEMTGQKPETGERRTLFRLSETEARTWEHLVIHGEHIANILFDPLGEDIPETTPGTKALDEALIATPDTNGSG